MSASIILTRLSTKPHGRQAHAVACDDENKTAAHSLPDPI